MRVERLIEEQTPTSTVWYEYDALGLRTAMRFREGAVLHSYNRANQLVAQTDLSGGQTTFAYGPDGEVYEIHLPGGAKQVDTYDPITRRLEQRAYTTPRVNLTLSYVYDVVGNVTTLTQKDSGQTKTYTYEYDKLYRLTREETSKSRYGSTPTMPQATASPQRRPPGTPTIARGTRRRSAPMSTT